MAEIVLKNIVKRFGDLIAVNDLSLNISDKEFLVLLGPSGCGKTTTLRCISGLETPDEGKILIDGEDVTIKELAEMIVEVTGYENDYEWDTSKPNGTPRKVLNVDKMKSLGWEPKIGLREGLESTYEWMKNNESNLRSI